MINSNYRICSQCDLVVELDSNQQDANILAVCPRCYHAIQKYTNTNKHAAIYAILALVILYLLLFHEIFYFNILENKVAVSVTSISKMLFQQENLFLSIMFITSVLILPTIFLVSIIISSFNLQLPNSVKINILLIIEQVKPWCMADIFLFSLLISFIKLKNFGDLYFSIGFYAFFMYMILQVAAYSLFDTKLCWQKIDYQQDETKSIKEATAGKIGLLQKIKSCHYCEKILPLNIKTCPRCKKHSEVRNYSNINIILALLLTSSILYIPANLLPMMHYLYIGNYSEATIMGGIIKLWQMHDYIIAVIIFTASVMIPILKIILLFILVWILRNYNYKTVNICNNYTKTFNFIKLIGRWSMLDVFVVTVLSATIDSGFLLDNKPDLGVIFFSLVVIITMIAAELYDPRFIWDKNINKQENNL